MKKIKIVTDSSSDVVSLSDVPFASAPLKIITADKQYTDDAELDVEEMANELSCYSGKSSTSCPSPDDWIRAFGDAEEIFCITITSLLSGSYNTACIAKDIYEDEHPERRVFVFNSKSTGPEMAIMIDKVADMINAGKDFDEICNYIENYRIELLFMLSSMKNLANNGRVSPIAAKLAGILGIRAIGKASEEGTLEMLDKVKGENKAIETMLRHIKELGYTGGKIKIAHCLNEKAAQKLGELIHETFSKAKIEIYKLRGLCSFYAEKGGMIVGFEA